MKILFLVATLLISTTANAAIIDFESYNPGYYGCCNSFDEDGYTVKYDNSKVFSGWGSLTPAQNGQAIVDPWSNDTVRLTKNDGGLFTVNSIELGNVSQTTFFDLTFTGVKANNQTISQTFSLTELNNSAGVIPMTIYNFNNFTGLKELYWYGSEWPKNYGFDNINVTEYISAPVSSVPVPASIWLFASGLPIVLGFKRRNIKA